MLLKDARLHFHLVDNLRRAGIYAFRLCPKVPHVAGIACQGHKWRHAVPCRPVAGAKVSVLTSQKLSGFVNQLDVKLLRLVVVYILLGLAVAELEDGTRGECPPALPSVPSGPAGHQLM